MSAKDVRSSAGAFFFLPKSCEEKKDPASRISSFAQTGGLSREQSDRLSARVDVKFVIPYCSEHAERGDLSGIVSGRAKGQPRARRRFSSPSYRLGVKFLGVVIHEELVNAGFTKIVEAVAGPTFYKDLVILICLLVEYCALRLYKAHYQRALYAAGVSRRRARSYSRDLYKPPRYTYNSQEDRAEAFKFCVDVLKLDVSLSNILADKIAGFASVIREGRFVRGYASGVEAARAEGQPHFRLSVQEPVLFKRSFKHFRKVVSKTIRKGVDVGQLDSVALEKLFAFTFLLLFNNTQSATLGYFRGFKDESRRRAAESLAGNENPGSKGSKGLKGPKDSKDPKGKISLFDFGSRKIQG